MKLIIKNLFLPAILTLSLVSCNSTSHSEILVDTSTETTTETTEITNKTSNEPMELKITNVKHYLGYSPTEIKTYVNKELTRDLDLYYEIMDESICSISNDGYVTGLAIGQTTVYASMIDGTEESFEVYVNDPTEYIYNRDVCSREEAFTLRGNPKDSTIFIGDSFFDENNFWKTFYMDFECTPKCVALGISGSKSTDWMMFRDRLVNNYQPKNVVIHIGTNDINDNSVLGTIDGYYRQITDFLEAIVSKLPNTNFYYLGSENRTVSSGYGAKNAYAEQVTAKIKEEYAPKHANFTYIDSPSVFNANQEKYMSSDGIHPSADGYKYYVETLNQLIQY